MFLLAQAMKEASGEEIKQGYGGLVFIGLFFLALIIAFIWWLKRQT